jgi:PAS domain S-box-containing protein
MPNDHQEAIHEQRELLQVALDSIGDAVITTDTEGRITFMNPVAQAVTGWTLKEATGASLASVFKIVDEEGRVPLDNPVAQALREGLIVGLANHTLLITKDGIERAIDDSAAPIRGASGEVVGVVLVFRDISERRRAERALKESEERFRLLVESTHDYAIFMLDPKGNVASWNSGAERIKGYRAEEIIGKHFSCFYPKEAVATGWPERELARASTAGRFEDEGWRVRKDGSQFWANVIITAVRDEAGKHKGFAKITRDLTERRQLERTRIQAEVIADLNRRKDEFLAMLSHEIRNPLTPMVNAVHLLRRGEFGDQVQQQAIVMIERQLGHLTRLVDELLEVSRITTGTMRLQQEAMDLRDVVDRALETVRSAISQRKHNVTVTLATDPVWVHADPTRMEQVAVNLLTNAIKYTSEGGCIWVSVQQEGNEALLKVRDAGIGIASDLLPRIFDLFKQAEKSLDRSDGGLGVGLAVVQRIVEMHRGKVESFSAGLGHGSEFVVRLSLISPPIQHRASASDSDRIVRSLRVLVVDDNSDAADSAAILLRQLGHEVRVAYSGTAALEAALSFQPEVVLLDLGLPDIDGCEVAVRLRQNPDHRKARIIAVSGYGQEADFQRSQEAGFDTHLVKPVDPQKLAEVLATRC